MLAALLIALLHSAEPAPAPELTGKELKALLAKLPAHFVEVNPRNNFAIVYACDDAPVKLGLDGTRATVTFLRDTARFEVVGALAPEAERYTLLVREAAKEGAPFKVELKRVNPAHGLWSFWGDENRMFTGRKVFIDETFAKTVKTIRPAQGECGAARGD